MADDHRSTKSAQQSKRHNKLYRCPPTPPPESLLREEKGFVLDCNAAFPGTSIDGRVMDYFEEKGAGYQYVHLRNEAGGGHSRELVDGHAQFMQGIKPVMGYNGSFGFRRNTPWLRQSPSPFGTASRSPAHEITVVSKTKTVQAK